MNELQIFNNEEFGQIRTIEIDGEPWFVGKDVAEALGYADVKNAVKSHVDDDDRRLIQKGQFTPLDIPNRGLTIINESGLYSLIFASKLPTAKKFKRWVTSEVLPALRRRGAYIIESNGCEYITPRERLSLAKLIANTTRDRLPAVKKIVQPLIGEDLDELLPTLPGEAVFIDDDEVIKNAYRLAQTSGQDNETEYIIDKDIFNETFSSIGGRTARKILDEHGLLVRDSADIKTRTRLCLRYVDGKSRRCIVIKKQSQP